jgi:hypothetical protein
LQRLQYAVASWVMHQKQILTLQLNSVGSDRSISNERKRQADWRVARSDPKHLFTSWGAQSRHAGTAASAVAESPCARRCVAHATGCLVEVSAA